MSRPSDITPVDPADHVRRYVERYFSSGEFNVAEVIAQIVQGALILGAADVEVAKLGTWRVIASSEDWLPADRATAAFSSLAPFPESGRNGFHSEFLLTVFARSVLTVGPDGTDVVKGSSSDEVIRWAAKKGKGRTVAFEP